MTAREKTAWVALITSLVIWFPYFIHFTLRIANRDLDGSSLLTLFLICLGAHFVLMFGTVFIWVRRDRQKFDAPLDEREIGIDARANRLGAGLAEALFGLLALLAFPIAGVAATSFAADPTGAMAILLAHAALLAGMVYGLTREIAQIVLFRRMEWGQ